MGILNGKLCNLLTVYIVVFFIGKFFIFIRSLLGGGGILYGDNFPLRGMFLRVSFQGEVLQSGNFPESPYKARFICLNFSLVAQFYTWTCLFGGIVWRKFSVGLNSVGDLPVEENFPVESTV